MSMPFSDEELLEPVQAVLDEQVREFVQKDGGDIHIVEIKNGCVYIKFEGACVGCKAKDATVHNLVAHKLQLAIHPDIKVIATN